MDPIINKPLILSFLLYCGISSGFAQKTDTLHRQLQVLTSQEEQIDQYTPLSLTFSSPSPIQAKQIKLTPSDLRNYPTSIVLDPIKSINPLLSYYDLEKQRGYAEFGIGLKYNAYLSAGLRALEESNKSLDFHLDGRYTSFDVNNLNILRKAKEQALKLYSRYQTLFANGVNLDLKAQIAHEKHNYYGIEVWDKSVAAPLNLNWLTQNQAKAELIISKQDQRELIGYTFKPRISYTSVKGISDLSSNYKANELNLGISGLFIYNFASNNKISLELDGQSYIYRSDALDNQEKYPYGNNSRIDIKPYWGYRSLNDIDWGIDLGLTTHFYTQRGNQKLYLSPYIAAHIKPTEEWRIHLKAQGVMRNNSLSEMLTEMPYLGLGHDVTASYSPIDIQLKVDGLVSPEWQIELFSGFTYHKSGVNYEANTQERLGQEKYSPIVFRPTNAYGRVFTFGAKTAYHFASDFTIRAKVAYNHWSKSKQDKKLHLYGRPKLELLTELDYRPLQALNFVAGYELKHGIEQGVRNDQDVSLHSLPALSLLRLSANYQIAKSWTIGAMGHILLSGENPLYYGYNSQRFSTTFTLSYKF